MWPVLPVVGRPEHIDITSWVGRSDEGGGLRAGSAGQSLVRSALDGAGIANLTDGRACDRRPSGDGTLVGLAVDSDLADNTVGFSERKKHERNKEGEDGKEKSRGLHCLSIERKMKG